MTIKEFAQEVFNRADPCTCYIAVMEGDEHYNLEVEVSDGVIAGTYDTNCPVEGGHDAAAGLADELDKELTALGFTVCGDREEWEDFLFGEEP